MKNNDISKKLTRKIRYLKLSVITVFILIITLFALSVTIFADNAFRVENCNKCEEYSQKLGEEINRFIELDSEPTKTVSTQVTASINEYRKKIIDLQSHADVEKRSLENEILLAYTQGSTAGQIAWVYYYNIYTFDSSLSVDKINVKYSAFKSAISNATQYTVLAAECNVMLDELNELIYTQRALNLALPNDSLTASALISGTVEKFKSLYSADLFAESYATEYASLVKELGLQRVRDALKSECEQTFKLIRANESFASSSSASLLVYELNTAKSIKAMNNAVLSFIKELLIIEKSKPYSAQTKQEFISKVHTAASRATENQTAAKITEIFTDYPLIIKKSEIKDSVYALFLGDGSVTDESLLSLEQSFNRAGGIIDSCQTDLEVEAELINAKSALFAHKHQAILNKQFDDLEVSDEQLTRDALIEYSALEESVKIKLVSEINIIAEKYNNILIKKINAFLPKDALYLDFCEKIAEEIKSVSRQSIDDFYNKTTKITYKAEALSKAMQEYRSILSASNYPKYTQAEKDKLLSILSELSSNLSKIDPSDIAIYYDEISDAKAGAIRNFNITDQSVRVRIAARGSASAEVLSELNIAYEKISICSEKSEMILQANRAIYKIERILTSDNITSYCEELQSNIKIMDFLEKSEKESFASKISVLSLKSKDAKEAENISVLEEIWNSFLSSLNSICAEAEAIDLSRAISVYIEEVTEASNLYLSQIKKLEYISAEKSAEICNSINAEQSSVKQDIPLCKSTASVLIKYAEFIEKLKVLLASAQYEDLNGYKNFLVLKFDQYENIKANYSAENYNKILDIKSATIQILASATSKNECDSILTNAFNNILLINDLLEDEKDNALASLFSLLEALKKDSPLYSKANFSKIEGLYDEAKIEIGKITGIANISLVKQTLSRYSSLLCDIRKDSLYTSESAHNIATPSLKYTDDYNFSNGLLGSIHLNDGLVSDAKFSIKLLEQARNKQIEELIRKSAKNGSLITFERLPSGTLKLLRNSSVAATLDITLSSIDESASGYTVQLLIPNELCNENILGLAFVKDDKVEFYPINQADSLISAKLDHFSKYYIVVESTLNVKPLLIALIILLILEFLVLIGIVYLRYKRKNEEIPQNDFPALPMSAFIPFAPALTRVYPENGLSLAILLSIAAIALASTIALLIRKEAKENYKVLHNTQKQLKGRKNQLLLNAKSSLEKDENVFFESNDNELCIVGATVKSKYNVAEIDLDLIAESFKSSELVNLNSLKQKGLVNENTEYIKILTKGNLTKPLTIEANEFSNAAKDIIKLSGGEIRII